MMRLYRAHCGAFLRLNLEARITMSGRQSAAVDKALALIGKGKPPNTPYKAAKLTGIALSTIYRAQKRERERKA